MSFTLLTTPADHEAYATWISTHPQNNLWQSLERAAYCKAIGQEVRVYAVMQNNAITASAQVMIDAGRGGSVWEVPRGPLWDAKNPDAARELCIGILEQAKTEKALAVYFSPLLPLPSGIPDAQDSHRSIHAEATRILDLEKAQAEILSQMHPKGRYNIRVAEKSGVTVQQSDDVESFYRLVKETGARDKFGTLPKHRYQAFFGHLPGSFLLLAEHEGRPIAGLLGVIYNKQGIYYYGASSYASRQLMAPYALQWAAIEHCKAAGCTTYDLLGIAPQNAEKAHSWAGISEFKAKFGGTVINYPPEQMVVLRPWTFKLLKWKRRMLG